MTGCSGCLFVAALLLCAPTNLHAQNSVTVDELVGRAQVVIAALSPDGRYAAYVVARGNAIDDVYDMTVGVIDTRENGRGTTLHRYELSPQDTFNEFSWLENKAGDLHWIEDDVLLFVDRFNQKARMATWDARDSRIRVLLEGYDEIAIDAKVGDEHHLSVTTISTVVADASRSKVRDNSWLMRDDYQFWGAFKNPKVGRRVEKQKWVLSFEPNAVLTPYEDPLQEWELSSESRAKSQGSWFSIRESENQFTVTVDAMPSGDGKVTAVVEYFGSNLQTPGASFSGFRMFLKEGHNRRDLIPEARQLWLIRILGWSEDGSILYYISTAPDKSVLYGIDAKGDTRQITGSSAWLERPGANYARRCTERAWRCQAISRDGKYALLVRQTNMPGDELIKIDLATGGIVTLESPSDMLTSSAAPLTRLYRVGSTGGDAWGRLYLPSTHADGTRYPLVITQYISFPGYEAAVGDEVPISVLVANGIAVFAMHSRELNHNSSTGDARLEVNRLRRPLAGMEWIVERLVEDGLVDPNSIGLTGLSYGAEIAMYGYWKSRTFRAVSVATPSWDPALHVFGGVNFASSLERRGFPPPDERGMQLWRDVSAGLNARETLPPLLIQSPDREENFTIPTWVRLRRAGAIVEWYEYPNEGHIKQSPANKWWVFKRNLQWFRFWLKDEEEDDSVAPGQYIRWRELREQLRTSLKSPSTTAERAGDRMH